MISLCMYVYVAGNQPQIDLQVCRLVVWYSLNWVRAIGCADFACCFVLRHVEDQPCPECTKGGRNVLQMFQHMKWRYVSKGQLGAALEDVGRMDLILLIFAIHQIQHLLSIHCSSWWSQFELGHSEQWVRSAVVTLAHLCMGMALIGLTKGGRISSSLDTGV